MAPNWIIRFLALAFGACAAAFAQPADHPYGRSQPIPGRYIVVFKAHVADPAAETASLARGLGAQLHFTYTSAIKGFAATLPDAAVQALRNNPNVDYVEQDQTVSLNAHDELTPHQHGATWGLDRIDVHTLSLDALYHYNYMGAGVYAFIIDTGIRSTHIDFNQSESTNPYASRVLVGRNFVNGANDVNTEDCNGHGTHVAGTVGGLTWGVAKRAALVPVRVLNCQGSGTWSGVIAGIDFSANSILRPAVANMSLGGSASNSVNQAVAGAVSKGLTMVVAAGNSNADACKYSPAGEPSAITVGATNSIDERAYYSNYGKCLDIFAPGSGITSAWHTSDTASNTISGTSMASPHVTGVAALALEANPDASPWAVAAFINDRATTGPGFQIYLPGADSPNLLVYSLGSGTPNNPTGTNVTVDLPLITTVKTYNNGWRASVLVTIVTPTTGGKIPVNEITVVGSFSPGGTASCITGQKGPGRCELISSTISKNAKLTIFTINSVFGFEKNYAPVYSEKTEIRKAP